MGLMTVDFNGNRRRAQSLAAQGYTPSQIATRMRLNRTAVYRLLDDMPEVAHQADRRALVAAARPWAQFRWSAKDGPSW